MPTLLGAHPIPHERRLSIHVACLRAVIRVTRANCPGDLRCSSLDVAQRGWLVESVDHVAVGVQPRAGAGATPQRAPPLPSPAPHSKPAQHDADDCAAARHALMAMRKNRYRCIYFTSLIVLHIITPVETAVVWPHLQVAVPHIAVQIADCSLRAPHSQSIYNALWLICARRACCMAGRLFMWSEVAQPARPVMYALRRRRRSSVIGASRWQGQLPRAVPACTM